MLCEAGVAQTGLEEMKGDLPASWKRWVEMRCGGGSLLAAIWALHGMRQMKRQRWIHSDQLELAQGMHLIETCAA